MSFDLGATSLTYFLRLPMLHGDICILMFGIASKSRVDGALLKLTSPDFSVLSKVTEPI
tara:strand:- start:257 stop:433 length:177 start_codon:yes stop_codon:yes gene_type:complete